VFVYDCGRLFDPMISPGPGSLSLVRVNVAVGTYSRLIITIRKSISGDLVWTKKCWLGYTRKDITQYLPLKNRCDFPSLLWKGE